jgi:gliding motility-associated protein GldL
MAKLYGWGAAVVILGALFKIQHWKGAGAMLTLGLSTEALIFFLSAFDKQKEFDWAKVYPELVAEEDEEGPKKSISAEIDKMLEDAKIEAQLVNKLGEGMNKLSNTVSGLNDITDAAAASNNYAQKVNIATSNVEKVSASYEKTAEAMTHMNEASSSSKEYFEQIKNASGNLASLNSAYEQELRETNKHLDAMNKVNERFSEAMNGLAEASTSSKDYISQIKTASTNLAQLNNLYEIEQTEAGKHREAMTKYQNNLESLINNFSEAGSMSVQLKEGFAKLNENLSSLNNIYGNMLIAMNPNRA